MAVFSKPFLNWLDEDGFFVAQYWDIAENLMKEDGKMGLFPWQRQICEYTLTQHEDGSFPYLTVVLSDPKKTGKSAWAAAVGAWFAECAPPHTEVYVCANSQEQSERRIYGDLCYHFEKRGGWKVTKGEILNPETGTVIRTITKSYTSAAGSRHALTLWDELHGATSEDDWRRWDEMTPIPTVPHSLRIVASYAGFFDESKLLYDLYLNGVDKDEDLGGKGEKIKELDGLACYKNGNLFVHWGHGFLFGDPSMPWQTAKYYDDAMGTERETAFLRLHENRWVTSNEIFIPIEWWDRAASKFEQSAEIWNDHPYRYSPVYLSVDTGMKHDCTGVVGVSPDEKLGKVIQVFHKKWTPIEGEILNLQLVEDYIVDKCKRFNVVEISCDPSQMLQIMNRLRSLGYTVFEFTQAGSAMVRASQNLYDLLHNQNLWAYPSDDMKEHLQNVVAQATSAGYRIVKDKTNRRLATKKIDLAVALAMACSRAVENMGVERIDPIVIEACLSRYSDNRPPKEPSYIPFELRDN